LVQTLSQEGGLVAPFEQFVWQVPLTKLCLEAQLVHDGGLMAPLEQSAKVVHEGGLVAPLGQVVVRLTTFAGESP
jgi:hypothetical protein